MAGICMRDIGCLYATIASVSSAAADSRADLAFEHEPLDVGREIGMTLEPQPAGDLDEHEAAFFGLVLPPRAVLRRSR